ncbi:transposase (plasmid) [Paracoccus aminovorans]|nr:transposase [Paracoccus aminovorans]
MDREDGFAVARPARRVRVVEQHVPPFQPVELQGIWWRIFAAMSDDADFEYLIVDSTIIRAHQHASGAKKGLKIRPLADPVAA